MTRREGRMRECDKILQGVVVSGERSIEPEVAGSTRKLFK